MIQLRTTGLTIGAMLSVVLASGSAHAGAALDDDNKPAATEEQTPEQAAAAAEDDGGVTYGVGLRGRHLWLPQGVLELFLQRAPGGASNWGYGVEIVRRRENFELQLGLEFEHITVAKGAWLDKNKSIPADEVDYVQDGIDKPFGWFTIDFTFINHAPITKEISFRYGGGAGIGILTGQVTHIDRACSGSTFDTCELGQGGTNTNGGAVIPYDLPPVFPVITGLVGFQFKPIDNLTINVEAGIRTLPFAGISSNYFF
jgi:hypothetical protein